MPTGRSSKKVRKWSVLEREVKKVRGVIAASGGREGRLALKTPFGRKVEREECPQRRPGRTPQEK